MQKRGYALHNRDGQRCARGGKWCKDGGINIRIDDRQRWGPYDQLVPMTPLFVTYRWNRHIDARYVGHPNMLITQMIRNLSG